MTIEEQSPLSIPPHSSSKNLALDIRSLLRQLLGIHAVIHTSNPLLDNRTLVQIGSHKVSSRSDNLDTALVRLVVGLGTLERGQETVVDVDDAAGHGLAQRRGQNLHVARKHNELDAVLLAEVEDLAFLLRLGVFCDGQVVELDPVALSEGGVVGVVRHDDGDLHAQLAGLHAEEQVVETVADLGDHDEDTGLAGDGTNIVVHLVLGGELVESLDEVLGGLCLGRAKVNTHEEALGDGIGELLEVENVVLVGGKDASHGIDDAGLVRA